ncbi:EscU/YscU/HrcU family type III secretion system export apparatus switch protein [Arthrobacter sp. zg-Y826]|uniref:EscU/YscU/HrcU family type III secretion system export apparatus switch protein n=1 Tax=Arthrobacter jinronghuae TaxID=2964609 RepID=UPI002104BBCC|nr:EscU/YscU/HrcU family type III secretion system export apparatus switch protein [Arthrobacter jinronghuae]MCQ1957685.1 EscU/YscU/HrcU family type III secretion system export apparatus switch protein [Arthrobacter jinronghuae]
MPEQPSGERTEQATDKRMKEVRSKGQLSRSEDLTAWVGVGTAALMMPLTISRGTEAAGEILAGVATTIANPDPEFALTQMNEGLGTLAFILGPLLGVVAAVVLMTAAVQGGIHMKKFKGKFEQFNVITGVKRVFGTQALWNGAKSLLKTAVVGLVLYAVIQQLMPVLMSAGGLPISAVLEAAGGGTALLLQAAVAAGLILAAADIFVVMKRNRKRTRMTKKEVKDENKNSDGDPLVKSQRRSRQLAMSRNRMIAAVADADVVLVNPTHVAVALKYEPGKSAPRVVAKGADNIATRIREEAEKQGVPMVSDIPLARALHSACELNAEIPPELYNAVARVLAFVMALKRRGAARGMHTMAAAPPEPVTTPQHRKAAS